MNVANSKAALVLSLNVKIVEEYMYNFVYSNNNFIHMNYTHRHMN